MTRPSILFALILFAFSCMAQAGVVSTLNPNYVSELEDVDYERLIRGPGDNTKVEQGDLLLAVLEINAAFNVEGLNSSLDGSASRNLQFDYTTSTNTFTAISLIKVAAAPVVTGQVANFVFEAPTAAEWLAHTGVNGVSAGTMAILFDHLPANPHVDPTTIASGISTAISGTRLWEFGLTGAAGEFWTASTVSFVGDPTDILQIDLLNFLANLNTTALNGQDALNKHNALGDPDLTNTTVASFFSPADLQIQGQSESGTRGAFDVRTDTNLYIHANPEPASLLAWAGLIGMASFSAYRRRSHTCN